MSLLDGDSSDVLNQRKNFLKELGINYQDLVCVKQVHTSNVRYIQEEDRGKGALSFDSAIADTDALITNIKNLPLAIFTADCLPIFLFAPLVSAIGLIHAGWRGTQENITTKTIKLMQEKFNIAPLDLYAGFGPGVRDCCYEVGEEFRNIFVQDLIERDNRYYLDLIKANKKQLLDLGVKDTNISDSGICTSCQNNEFFSYRREANTAGRIMSVIMLK